MKIVDINSWEEFEREIEKLKAKWLEIRKNTSLIVSDPLFRGHSDAKWHLKTTLERYLHKPSYPMDDYYRTIYISKHRIEAFTEKTWSIPTIKEYRNWLENYDPFEPGEFKAYEYMAYLRHYSFPSPLLDWTTSPYIAAFFAFRKIHCKSKKVAIFSFIEQTGRGKHSTGTEPYIQPLGPYINSHKRHFLQQSNYTVCISLNNQNLHYAAHQKVFDRDERDQDLLRKYIIPATERTKALKKLDSYNINAHFLFGSEESLMETIAMREFILRKNII